jgi:glutamate racemase
MQSAVLRSIALVVSFAIVHQGLRLGDGDRAENAGGFHFQSQDKTPIAKMQATSSKAGRPGRDDDLLELDQNKDALEGSVLVGDEYGIAVNGDNLHPEAAVGRARNARSKSEVSTRVVVHNDTVKPQFEHVLRDADGNSLLDAFWAKKKPRIVFADSGIGALDIMSRFLGRYHRKPLFTGASLIFIDTGGVDADKSMSKINALKPDLLLIACNGMSSNYVESRWPTQATYPVIHMLPFGTDLWGKALTNDSSGTVITYVSATTTDTYVPLLEEKYQLDRHQIHSQSCADAVTDIMMKGPDSDEAVEDISKCVKQSWQKLSEDNKNGTLYLGMGCTAFGFSSKHWKKAIQDEGATGKVEVLDPNQNMADWLFENRPSSASEVNASVQDFDIELGQTKWEGVGGMDWDPALVKAISEQAASS